MEPLTPVVCFGRQVAGKGEVRGPLGTVLERVVHLRHRVAGEGTSPMTLDPQPASVSTPVEGSADHKRQVRKAALASTVGTTIEWYDFFLYNTAAALIF